MIRGKPRRARQAEASKASKASRGEQGKPRRARRGERGEAHQPFCLNPPLHLQTPLRPCPAIEGWMFASIARVRSHDNSDIPAGSIDEIFGAEPGVHDIMYSVEFGLSSQRFSPPGHSWGRLEKSAGVQHKKDGRAAQARFPTMEGSRLLRFQKKFLGFRASE